MGWTLLYEPEYAWKCLKKLFWLSIIVTNCYYVILFYLNIHSLSYHFIFFSQELEYKNNES